MASSERLRGEAQKLIVHNWRRGKLDWSAAVCKAPAAARGKALRHQAYSSRLVLRSCCGWSRFAGHSRAPGSVRGCVQTKTGGWNSLYSPRFLGILQILNFSESAQVYGKTYGS